MEFAVHDSAHAIDCGIWRQSMSVGRGHLEADADLTSLCGDLNIDPARLKTVRTIGQGAYAQVELCVLEDEGGAKREVAVKKLRAHVLDTKDDLVDFVRCARCAKRSCLARLHPRSVSQPGCAALRAPRRRPLLRAHPRR